MRDHIDDETLDGLLTGKGRLSAREEERARAHVRECAACKQAVESTERLLALADSLPREERPDPRSFETVAARIRPQMHPSERYRRQRRLAPAAILLLVGAVTGAGAVLAVGAPWRDGQPSAASPAPATTTFDVERDRAMIQALGPRGRFIRRSYDSLRVIDRQLDSLEFLAPPSDSAARIRVLRLREARHFYWREFLRMIGEPVD